jgi:DNA mismatch repair protein MutL
MIYTIKTELENVGFSFEEFTKDDVTIKGIPISITESKITTILEELLNDINLEVP